MTILNTAEWAWVGSAQRHVVRFEHSTVSGKQRLWVDGEESFSSSWRFKLTGTLFLTLDSALVELHILSDAFGELYYRLTLNGELVPLSGGNALAQEAEAAKRRDSARRDASTGSGGGAASGGSGGGNGPAPCSPAAAATVKWRVCHPSKGGPPCLVEYSSTLGVLVGGARLEAEGAFVEEEPEVEEGGSGHGAVSSGVRYTFEAAGLPAELTVVPASGRQPPLCVLKAAGAIIAQL